MAGGLILGAFFMATDYVTSPLSARGKLIFGIGCGILTFVIRKYAGYPEGVSYAILIMNAAAPMIDRYTFPKFFGEAKR
jgi:electron transport complex protein RnfD